MQKSLICMMIIVVIVLLSCVTMTEGKGGRGHKTHRNQVPIGWTKIGPATKTETMKVQLLLKQSNLDVLQTLFDAVSDPTSPAYGQYKSVEELNTLVYPAQDITEFIVEQLSASYTLIKVVSHTDRIIITATVGVIEQIFNTSIFNYSRNDDGKFFLRQKGDASVPESISDYVDFVHGLNDFPPARTRVKHDPRSVSNKHKDQRFSIPILGRSPTPSRSSVPSATRTAAPSSSPAPSSTRTANPSSSSAASSSKNAAPSSTKTALPSTTKTAIPSTTKTANPSSSSGASQSSAPSSAAPSSSSGASQSSAPSSTRTANPSSSSAPSSTRTANPSSSSAASQSSAPSSTRTAIPSSTNTPSASKAGNPSPSPSPQQAHYSGFIIPDVIRLLYNYPTSFSNSFASTSIGLVEFSTDSGYSTSDYSTFNTWYAVSPPLPTFVNNYPSGYNPNTTTPDGESSLDVQYAAGLLTPYVPNLKVYYQITNGWMLEWTQTFLNTPNNSRPAVVSISWGADETRQSCYMDGNTACSEYNVGTSPTAYVTRVNSNLQMIALQGVSVFVSSGDNGALGNTNAYCNYTTMFPDYPASSPYLTSVGATMLAPSNVVAYSPSAKICSQLQTCSSSGSCSTYPCANTNIEVAASTATGASITTGGGFSAYSTMPSYQSTAVNAYISSQGSKLPNGANTNNRGYPDVSAIGHSLLIYNNNQYGLVDGTSASAPIWAAMAALINSARLAQGKSTLGFFNPALYQLYAQNNAAYKDITSGNNMCTEICCSSTLGYQTATGWDPVVGLGVPNYTALFNYAVAL